MHFKGQYQFFKSAKKITMEKSKLNLLRLFETPKQEIYVTAEAPSRVVSRASTIINNVALNEVEINDCTMPNMEFCMEIGRYDEFSLFIPNHTRIAGALIQIFIEQETVDNLLSVAARIRDKINPMLFNYALSVAILHRPDTKLLPIPLLANIFPEKFVHSLVFNEARKKGTKLLTTSETESVPVIKVPVNLSTIHKNQEQKLWYFREDLGINLHHWHWHLVYPSDASKDIVDKDRRGELFYYMHQQIVARYNAERLSNGLNQVEEFKNLREPIPEGYFPQIFSEKSWAPRYDNTSIQDVDIDFGPRQSEITISELERWMHRIYEAIDQGFINDKDGNKILLDENKGIDYLGNMLEASILSPNEKFYGSIHNKGHLLIGNTHDPRGRHITSPGVMTDPATAMRDPVFYKWHSLIDGIFRYHKEKLEPYTEAQLEFDQVSIEDIHFKSEEIDETNILQTFFMKSDVDISKGMDFSTKENISVRFTHLNHSMFSYSITVNNESSKEKYGTIRIFLAPKLDGRGLMMSFKEQRCLMIELDKFSYTLKSGTNEIERKSTDSSVTIPFKRTFPKIGGEVEKIDIMDFCGCGWPQHMLIPKGNSEGFQCQLFVMVTNQEEDQVLQETNKCCGNASSYCGIRDSLYPDKKAMGFPFDRLSRISGDNSTLESFLTSNMKVIDVLIKHRVDDDIFKE